MGPFLRPNCGWRPGKWSSPAPAKQDVLTVPGVCSVLSATNDAEFGTGEEVCKSPPGTG